MRCAITALIVCLGLLVWALQPAASQSNASAQPDASLADQSDAAEKHAKRTACLKEAKSKKLNGAKKSAYVKECMAKNWPPGSLTPVSSNSP